MVADPERPHIERIRPRSIAEAFEDVVFLLTLLVHLVEPFAMAYAKVAFDRLLEVVILRLAVQISDVRNFGCVHT